MCTCQLRPPRARTKTLRAYRAALAVSQAVFAERLGVSLETYRPWDAGRRPTPTTILTRAQALAAHRDDEEWLPLYVLAKMIGVSERTLRTAARDGRLPVAYDHRTTFRSLRPRASFAAALLFRQTSYKKSPEGPPPRAPRPWSAIPTDYDDRIRAARQLRSLSQAAFAARVGAAGKAVVYQWESRRRCPSPVFWERIEQLENLGDA